MQPYTTVVINTIYAHEDRAIDHMTNEQKKLDAVVIALEKEGVNLKNYQEKKDGLGDVIGNVFSKLGITEEIVDKWSGIGGCGCQKRKKFLNKIIPFRNKV
tara:strand:- start:54 stop:356 length:303 start_codon:yes stop_codon:yes gene_type:complete